MKQTETKEFPIVQHKIPDKLIYETIDGKPVYYKGYQDVIKLIKQFEEIMGSSKLMNNY